jgi:response regulator RpfG family c-di-GMP phosphodiesterase
LIRPIEEVGFLTALSGLLGNGKRVTIIGEELDSVLKLNAWATARGCSVSSAGDLKQGNEILDIVKPDLIVFDFSRLGAEGAGLVVKARRSARLEALPLLLVLPQGAQSPSAAFFMKRMSALAEETPLDFTPILRRMAPPEKV